MITKWINASMLIRTRMAIGLGFQLLALLMMSTNGFLLTVASGYRATTGVQPPFAWSNPTQSSLRDTPAFLSTATSTSTNETSAFTPPPTCMIDEDVELTVAQLHSPVLKQVYPAMVAYQKQYGHINIQLKTSEGRLCQTLRRLHIQQKLSASDVDFLTQLGFRWHSLEDVYFDADFDEMFNRLMKYHQEQVEAQKDNPLDQIDNDDDDEDEGTAPTGAAKIFLKTPPKKYDPDPELGAWVTGMRRLGRSQLDPEHVQKLDAVQFPWTSKRKCGSSFMKQYRALLQRLDTAAAEDVATTQTNTTTTTSTNAIWQDPTVRKWIQAQKEAAQRPGGLSETRKHYMATLLGTKDWIHWNG